jgi:hypothetical protein
MAETQVTVPVGIPSPTLDVICVGFGRTGTHSLREALRRFGYWPAEHAENCLAHPERYALWLEALRRMRGGEPIDWRPLLTGYRASLDWPAAHFWREMIAAHPAAKVILTVRDPEHWYESVSATSYARYLKRTQTLRQRFLYALRAVRDPRTGHRFRIIREVVWTGTFGGQFGDRAHAIRVFEEHRRMVEETVPPERLLVFDVKEGWEPLCQFLGVPVPIDEPFPHVAAKVTKPGVHP